MSGQPELSFPHPRDEAFLAGNLRTIQVEVKSDAEAIAVSCQAAGCTNGMGINNKRVNHDTVVARRDGTRRVAQFAIFLFEPGEVTLTFSAGGRVIEHVYRVID